MLETPALLTDLQDGDALDLRGRQERMVRDQIEARGVIDPDLIRAMRRVPRHRFVPRSLVAQAFDDGPLPIGYGQTISQPYIVAFAISQLGLGPHPRVLEVGTGCGYLAAVLAQLGAEVWTIDIVEPLALAAAERLARLGYEKVHVRAGDGAQGWPEAAPFDGIIVSCGAPTLPKALVAQLAPNGRLVCPVGPKGDTQQLIVAEKDESGRVTTWGTIPVRFVPLTGPSGEP